MKRNSVSGDGVPGPPATCPEVRGKAGTHELLKFPRLLAPPRPPPARCCPTVPCAARSSLSCAVPPLFLPRPRFALGV
jgi:hypothetical protein